MNTRFLQSILLWISFGFMIILSLTIFSSQARGEENQKRDPVKTSEKLQTISGEFRLLGKNTLLPHFKFLVLEEDADGFQRKRYSTDHSGRYHFDLKQGVSARLFALGAYEIPASWKNVQGENQKQEHLVYVRPMVRVTLSGQLHVPEKTSLEFAKVFAAPLDLLPNGSFYSFEPPLVAYVDEEDNYTLELSTGYYMVWAHWEDRKNSHWNSYFALFDMLEVFESQVFDITLQEQAWVQGKLVDKNSETPIDGIVDLYSNAYLHQRYIFTGSDDAWEEIGKGQFQAQLRAVNPDDFIVVARPQGASQTIKIIKDMNLEKLQELPEIVFRDEKSGRLDVKIRTVDGLYPVAPLEISISPADSVDVPAFLRPRLELYGNTDAQGGITFWGLPPGNYNLYTHGGTTLLGTIQVSGGKEEHALHYEIPYLQGEIFYPDGNPCTEALVRVEFELADGTKGTPRQWHAFDNPAMLQEGRFFVPLAWSDAKYRISFAAPGAGESINGNNFENMPYQSEAFELIPGSIKGFEYTIQLKENSKKE